MQKRIMYQKFRLFILHSQYFNLLIDKGIQIELYLVKQQHHFC
jgi:hypothetical protein